MEVIIYILIFIMGLLFGSFFTLAIYRIPLKENIVNKRSFCPNCNHRLEFLDLIPVLSYFFLKGKCRYCGQKIGKRYIILELCSGFIFLIYALSVKINFYYIEISKIIYLLFGFLYLICILITAGIDKEKRIIDKGVLTFGVITVFIYMLYLCVVENLNMYRYVIYLFVLLLILLLSNLYSEEKNRSNYIVNTLILSIFILIFSGVKVFELAMITTLMISLIVSIINSCRKKDYQEMLPIGFFLGITNIIMLILHNFTM